MSVYHYKEKEHPGGFIGYRVVVSLTGQKTRQQYFSEAKHGAQAQALAVETEARWLKERQPAANEKRVYGDDPRANIALGFRAAIICDTKKRAGAIRVYATPMFIVRSPVNEETRAQQMFNIRRMGYRNAFMAALKAYGDHHSLSAGERLSLLGRMPSSRVSLISVVCSKVVSSVSGTLPKMPIDMDTPPFGGVRKSAGDW